MLKNISKNNMVPNSNNKFSARGQIMTITDKKYHETKNLKNYVGKTNNSNIKYDDNSKKKYIVKKLPKRNSFFGSSHQSELSYRNFYNETDYEYNIKSELINYVYNQIDISKYKYTLVLDETHIDSLMYYKYYVSPNYNGINGLLVFVKI